MFVLVEISVYLIFAAGRLPISAILGSSFLEILQFLVRTAPVCLVASVFRYVYLEKNEMGLSQILCFGS